MLRSEARVERAFVFQTRSIERLAVSVYLPYALAFPCSDSWRSAILKSQIVQIQINRPYGETYRIVSKPENFPRWSPVLEPRFEPRGNNGLDWLIELPTGTHVISFSPPNDYGVLDYTVIPEDGAPSRTTRVRLVPNEDGCELVILFFRHPGHTDETFASYVEWATTDFMTLKTVVETI